MSRTRPLAVVALLVVIAVPGVVAAASVDVTVSSMSVSPDEPVPGDEVTIKPTIQNFASSDAGYFVDKVAIIDENDDGNELASVRDIGVVAADDSRTVPLTATLDETGTRDLRVQVIGRSTASGGQTRLRYPISITVSDRRPQMEIDAEDATVGVRERGTVTVANSLGSRLSDLELRIDGEDATITNRREVFASLAANESTSVDFRYAPRSVGDHDLTATLTYTTAGGTTANETVTETIRAQRTEPQMAMDVNGSIAGVESTGTVRVENVLGGDLADAELTVDGDGVTAPNPRTVLGTVPANESERVRFQYLTESAGEYDLTATLTYTTDGRVTDSVTETISIRSEERHPQIAADVNDSVAGIAADGTVTVANGLGTEVTNVEVTVDGENATVRDDRAVFTRLADGESAETAFTVEPESAGDNSLAVTLTYTTDNGLTRTVTQPVAFTTDPLRDRITLDVSAGQSAESPRVAVDVLNQGNAPITNVTLSGTSPNATVQRALVSRVGAGETRTVRLNATLDSERADVDVGAAYDVGNHRGERSGSTTLTQVPGTIGLTGVSVTDQGGRVQISGSASNFGTTDADSVVVRVRDTENVTPAQPNREFFVGTVPASDFVSFDVYATAEGNVSTIPLEVGYLVDGDRVTRTVDVDAASVGGSPDPQEASENTGGGSGLGVLLPVAIGLAIAVAVIGLIVRAWRNSRGGD